MERYTDLLTLYFPQPCLKKDGPYAKIQKVKSYKENRLSYSKGNVNLTDVWYAMLDSFMEQDMAYSCQYIDLLSDKDGDWWERQVDEGNEWICLGFFKWNLENEQYENVEKEIMRGGVCSGKYFWTFGNADFIYAFSGRNVSEIMEKISIFEMLDREKNLFFSKNYLYGQCIHENTSWVIHNYKLYEKNGCRKHSFFENGKCMEVIKGLLIKEEDYRKKKNKKMMAYYQALGQTVSILAQYEQEKLFKDLFYIFYPPISLFLNQLQQAESEIEKIDKKQMEMQSNLEKTEVSTELIREKYSRTKKLEQSISEFIDAIELLLHHMGHSCRDILSDVGRGGIPFDIPLHLCLMYIAFLNELTYVLNDKDYEYEYCLAPLAYSRPITECFDFGLDPGDRLIRVQISRHMMFMPRSLLIILSHEVSHYVSEEPRARQLRAKCFLEIANLVVVHRLIPENILEKLDISPSNTLEKYLTKLRMRIYSYLRKKIWQLWNIKHKKELDLHLSTFCGNISILYREILEDKEQTLSWLVDNLDLELVSDLRNKMEGDQLVRDLLRVQDTIKARTLTVWYDDVLSEFLESLSENLKEIYADVSAICVLDLDPDVFLEAYVISESYIPSSDTITPALINRIALVKSVLEEERKEWNWEVKRADKNMEVNSGSNIDGFLNLIKIQVNSYLDAYNNIECKRGNDKHSAKISSSEDAGDLYYFKNIIDLERKYLSECYSKIKENLKNSTQKQDREYRRHILKNVFAHFKVADIGEDTTYENFMKDYNIMVNNYKKSVQSRI